MVWQTTTKIKQNARTTSDFVSHRFVWCTLQICKPSLNYAYSMSLSMSLCVCIAVGAIPIFQFANTYVRTVRRSTTHWNSESQEENGFTVKANQHLNLRSKHPTTIWKQNRCFSLFTSVVRRLPFAVSVLYRFRRWHSHLYALSAFPPILRFCVCAICSLFSWLHV